MPTIQAERDLIALKFADVRLSADAMFDLVLRATGSRETAEQVTTKYLWNQLAEQPAGGPA